MIRAIAFDLDGTLVDSVPDLARAANAARVEQGLPALPTERVERFVGDGVNIMVARSLADDVNADYTGTPEQVAALASFDVHYKAGLTINTKFYAQVRETLEALNAMGLPLALVTNKAERYTLPLLAELGVRSLFAIIVGGDTLPQKKPDGEPLLHVAAQLGIEAEELLMVGDSKNDVLCAKNAGCPSAVVSHGYGVDLEALGADIILPNFSELLTVVGP